MKNNLILICFSFCLLKNGKTALIYASYKGYKEVVDILVKTPNINVNLQDKVM